MENSIDYDSNLNLCAWDEEPRKQNDNMMKNAEMYKMNYKEFQCYIYNQLEDIKSTLLTILEVANRK